MKKTTIILCVLCNKGEQTGRAIAENSEGRIGRGGIYTILARLEKEGLVESRTVQPRDNVKGVPRRLYRATDAGLRAARADTDLVLTHTVPT